MKLYNTLKELCLCPSISGRENKIREKLTSLITPLCDEVRVDALGNLIALKKSAKQDAKKVMLAAHMDEIGFIATFIEDNGMVRLAPVGWIEFSASAFSLVVSEKGVKGAIVPETRTKPEDYKATNFYIDIGAKDKKSAEARVKIGDFFVAAPSLDKLLGSRVCGRPLDDRVSCVALLGIAEALASKELDCDVYYVFSVQEEVGHRGALTATFSIAPDVALCFDVTGTGDSIGAVKMACKVGGGAAVKIKDRMVICDEQITTALCAVAKEKGIKHQREILPSGATDTEAMQLAGAGVSVGAISIPTRYIHTGVELCDLDDVRCCIELATEYIKTL